VVRDLFTKEKEEEEEEEDLIKLHFTYFIERANFRYITLTSSKT